MFQQNYPSVQHPYSFELNKDFNFSAAHYIPSEDAGKCMRTHGHTYFVNLTIAGDTLDRNGFLVNFSELKQLVHGQLIIIYLMIYRNLKAKALLPKSLPKLFMKWFKLR